MESQNTALTRYEEMPLAEIEKIGTIIAKSKLFGVKTPDEAIALCLIAQAEGKHPATAALQYHIFNGRPSLKADEMLARFQDAGGIVEYNEYTDKKVSITFSHPSAAKPVTIDWTIEMAKAAELTGKDTWKKYPRSMLRSRAISEGVRAVHPRSNQGFYTEEEIESMLSASNAANASNAAKSEPDKPQQAVKGQPAKKDKPAPKNENIEEAKIIEEAKPAEEQTQPQQAHSAGFDEAIDEIKTAVNIDHLKTAFTAIKKIKWQPEELAALVAAKDERKTQLTEGV